MYANKLTKNDLLKAGIINVSADGLHITGIIRDFKQTPSGSGHLNCLGWGVHRIVYAWFHGEAPEGLVIDHINNNKTDLETYIKNADVLKNLALDTFEPIVNAQIGIDMACSNL